jgi:hypothetical protein
MHAQALGEESMSGSRKGKMQIGGHFDPRDGKARSRSR